MLDWIVNAHTLEILLKIPIISTIPVGAITSAVIQDGDFEKRPRFLQPVDGYAFDVDVLHVCRAGYLFTVLLHKD